MFGLKFKKELEKEGKKVQLFALTDITNDRLNNLRGIDAFIQVACPRISTEINLTSQYYQHLKQMHF